MFLLIYILIPTYLVEWNSRTNLVVFLSKDTFWKIFPSIRVNWTKYIQTSSKEEWEITPIDKLIKKLHFMFTLRKHWDTHYFQMRNLGQFLYLSSCKEIMAKVAISVIEMFIEDHFCSNLTDFLEIVPLFTSEYCENHGS